MSNLILVVDGITTAPTDVTDDLPRAIIISLFTWRRANLDDELPASNKYGWWGDSYPQQINDRIGSRLWLLSRAKLTDENILKSQEYAEEALQWLVTDGVASNVTVIAERSSLSELDLMIKIIRGDSSALNIRFTNVWDYINAAK
jgi:phage gp46-like protein